MKAVGVRTGWLFAAPLLILFVLAGCSSDDNKVTEPTDTTAPAAVANLATGTVTANSVVLSWTAPGDDGATGTAHQYDLRYSTTAITSANFASATAVSGVPAPAAAGSAQTFTVTGLTAGTHYYFALKTADEVPNWSALSNVAEATTSSSADVTPPAAVTDLTKGAVTANSVELTWTAPGDDGSTGTASHYDLRYSTQLITAANFDSAAQVQGIPAPSVEGTAESMTVTGLSPSTTYFFALKTGDEVINWSAISNVEEATTLEGGGGDSDPPSAITDLAAGGVTSSSVDLTWTAPGDDGSIGTAQAYDLRFSKSPITTANFNSATAVTGVPAPSVAGSAEAFTVTGLEPGTLYYFALKAMDEVPNVSGLSNVAQATTSQAADTQAPAAVQDLAALSAGSTSVNLTWTAPGDDGSAGTASQYDLRYSTQLITAANFNSATAVTGVPAPSVAGSAETFTVTGLEPGTLYYFALKTMDEVPNVSGLSNVAQATTSQAADTQAPAAVQDLAALPADSTSVNLIWTAPGDDGDQGTASTYDIRYSTATITEGNWAAATQVTGEPTPEAAGTVENMTVSGLNPDTDYFFAMKTSDEAPNTSTLSNVAEVHTPSGQTAPPGLAGPVFPDSVCITSSDQYAQFAKLIASSQLALVNAYSQLATAFFGPLGSAQWEQGQGCWTYDYDLGGCSGHYEACKDGSVYTYTLTLNGSCYGESYTNWLAYRAVFDTAAGSGTFYAFEPNTSTIAAAWVWTSAADGNSGTYTFFEGDPNSSAIVGDLQWSKSADGNVYDLTFTVPEDSKSVSHFVLNPCSGTVKTYQWDSNASDWWLENDIAWNSDGTGFWDIYDDTGTMTEHHTW